jgi:hypothetical protein
MEHKCYNAGINNSKIITETSFGHGDSSHITYVKCFICGRKSKEFSNYGFFDDKSLRLAQENFNDNLLWK